jgi:hypothetical protein
MHIIKTLRSISIVMLAVTLTAFTGLTDVWGHGEGTRITPESLTVRSGSELKVTVNGLVGTKTAIFRMTGISGKYDLGEFPISSDDFTQVLKIPADAPPGSYRLTVEGGGKSAKVVININ